MVSVRAPIESFFGHVKADWPHLEAITDPEILTHELERLRHEQPTPSSAKRFRHLPTVVG